ncbi:MAG TPA: hypothetical protein DCO79_06580 [Spirochaeta sp.]|nr:hypothetical protein [Spirochaeta sp.]
MKKIILLLAAVLVLAGCKAGDDEAVKEYLIIDSSSNKIINRYEYSEKSNELVRTVSYTDEEKLEKKIEYEYDSRGFLVQTVEQVPGLDSKVVTYETTEEFDSSGKLVKLVRTSSDGEVVETHFGYDETGMLRGVVEKDSRGNLLMKDY